MKERQKTANKSEQKPTEIRIVGKLVPAGTTKAGKTYDEFVAWKVIINKKKHDFRFTKDTDTAELDSYVKQGKATEFDVTVKEFWQMNAEKTQYPVYYGRTIIDSFFYGIDDSDVDEVPF